MLGNYILPCIFRPWIFFSHSSLKKKKEKKKKNIDIHIAKRAHLVKASHIYISSILKRAQEPNFLLKLISTLRDNRVRKLRRFGWSVRITISGSCGSDYPKLSGVCRCNASRVALHAGAYVSRDDAGHPAEGHRAECATALINRWKRFD